MAAHHPPSDVRAAERSLSHGACGAGWQGQPQAPAQQPAAQPWGQPQQPVAAAPQATAQDPALVARVQGMGLQVTPDMDNNTLQMIVNSAPQ
jgi:hypothetical protein